MDIVNDYYDSNYDSNGQRCTFSWYCIMRKRQMCTSTSSVECSFMRRVKEQCGLVTLYTDVNGEDCTDTP